MPTPTLLVCLSVLISLLSFALPGLQLPLLCVSHAFVLIAWLLSEKRSEQAVSAPLPQLPPQLALLHYSSTVPFPVVGPDSALYPSAVDQHYERSVKGAEAVAVAAVAEYARHRIQVKVTPGTVTGTHVEASLVVVERE